MFEIYRPKREFIFFFLHWDYGIFIVSMWTQNSVWCTKKKYNRWNMYTIKLHKVRKYRNFCVFPPVSIDCMQVCGSALLTEMGSENGKWSIFKSKIQNEYGENIIDFHTLVSYSGFGVCQQYQSNVDFLIWIPRFRKQIPTFLLAFHQIEVEFVTIWFEIIEFEAAFAEWIHINRTTEKPVIKCWEVNINKYQSISIFERYYLLIWIAWIHWHEMFRFGWLWCGTVRNFESIWLT